MRKELIGLIKRNSFLKSDEPIFRLSSGQMSNVYFDLRRTTLCPEGQYLIGNLYMDMLETIGIGPKAIGGLTMGADPIATAVAYCSYLRERPVEAFVIRKEPKAHGLGLQIEGNVKKGDDVVVIDDVVTTGKSTIKAIEIARRSGLNILAVIALLDRCEQNGRQNIEALGLKFHSILTAQDITD